MTKTLTTLLATSAIALALGACQNRVMDSPPGSYERTTSYTDSDGTTRERQSSTDVTVDEQGRRKSVVKTKSTTDPKGLFNKSTTSQTEKTIEEK